MKFYQTNYQTLVVKNLMKLIKENSAMSETDALESFLTPETYKIFYDSYHIMWKFCALPIFDMWESEIATGRSTKFPLY